MKRRIGVAVSVVVVLLAVLWWLLGRDAGEAGGTSASASHGSTTFVGKGRAKPDVRGAKRGAIRGTVRDEAGAPVAKARVCADASAWLLASAETEAPSCTASDAQGGYQIGELLAASYEVSAGAPSYRFAVYEADPKTRRRGFALGAGELRGGVDLVLRKGGVEVTGVVNDIAGGPIAHALVRATRIRGERGPVVETDAQGKFSLWADRGLIGLTARADGYAPGEVGGSAPGTFELLLTPEGSLAGTVVDAATNQPVDGARVRVIENVQFNGNEGVAITDDQGRFRVEHLAPNRFHVSAATEHGYGSSAGSTLVGLGQHVDGVVVKLYPAHQIIGRVIVTDTHAPTDDCNVYLNDRAHGRMIGLRDEHDGRLIADGVIAASYQVSLYCKRFHAHDSYPAVVVADADASVTWEVDAGATIRGVITTHAGERVDGAELFAMGGSGAKRSSAFDHSRPDGTFALSGLLAGHYTLKLHSDRGTAPDSGLEVEIPAGATVVDHDLVLDDGGALVGSIADPAGKPMAGVRVSARPLENASWFMQPEARSDATGGFRFDGLHAGSYRVTAERGGELRKPGTTDDADQGERVAIRAGETATVRLVVEPEDGQIRGSVIDAAGKPVADAFVSSARESDAAGAKASSVASTREASWWGEDRPVLTGTDGAFTLAHLAPGNYTVRAYRKGGGEAIAEHVALGTTASLQIKPTGSIAGTVRASPPPMALKLGVRDPASGFSRSEWFYRTDGQFTLADLPAGHYQLTAEGDGGQGTATTDLIDGQARTGVELVLDARVDLVGRLVEDGGDKPVPGMRVMAMPLHEDDINVRTADDPAAVSDASGRFTIHDAPSGKLNLRGFPLDFQHSEYAYFTVPKDVPAGAASPFDLGTIGVLHARARFGDPVGELGLRFVVQADDVPSDQRRNEISWIDPAGPAAKSGLQVGDLITRCDGKDITGDNRSRWWTLARAPPGTKLALTTRRGPTYSVTLAPP